MKWQLLRSWKKLKRVAQECGHQDSVLARRSAGHPFASKEKRLGVARHLDVDLKKPSSGDPCSSLLTPAGAAVTTTMAHWTKVRFNPTPNVVSFWSGLSPYALGCKCCWLRPIKSQPLESPKPILRKLCAGAN
jgi:hypothetical protein